MGAENEPTSLDQLDQLVQEAQSRPSVTRDPYARPSIVALATSVGLIFFLLAEARPGGLSGVAGFAIGFTGVIAAVLTAMVVAVIVENRQRRQRRQLITELLVVAMLHGWEQTEFKGDHENRPTSDESIRSKALRILEQLHRELPQ